MLEHAFEGLDVQKVFVHPAYYFSNWLPQLPAIQAQGVLPTFYPVNLKIPMILPMDVANFTVEVMVQDMEDSPIYELIGPKWYSSQDVADAFGTVLSKGVTAQQILRERWDDVVKNKMEFADDAAKNFNDMSDLVNAGKSKPDGDRAIPINAETTLQPYWRTTLQASGSNR